MVEKSCIFLITLLIIVSAVIGASRNYAASKKCPQNLACNSDGCNRASQQILENLDETTNPCDNFYQFACGGYTRSKIIPNDQTQISTLSELSTLVTKQLHTLLKEPVSENEPNTFKLVKEFYNVCMNTRVMDENDLRTAKELYKKLGGWPVLEGDLWKENEFDWKKQTYKFRQYGFPVKLFLGIDVQPNAKNSSQRIVIFDEADLPVNRLPLMSGFNNSFVQSYYRYLVDLAVLHGADKSVALPQIKEVVQFLIELGKITLPPEDRRNLTAMTNIITVAELNQMFPHMDWIDFINNVIAIPGIRVYENDYVDVGLPNFISNLEVLLNKTPKRVQANYLMSVAVASIAYTLNQNVRNRQAQLMQEATGTKEEIPRWNECLNQATTKLKVAIGAFYARTFFKQNSKPTITLLVSNLQLKLLEMLKKVDWMDEETRKEALAKADSIIPHIAFPPELMDDEKIDQFYATVKPSKDYLEFVLNIQKFDSYLKFKQIREVVRRGYWVDISGTQDVNAFYNLAENTIIMPAGILQGLMFDVDRPQIMNYGAIGFIVGHELTHGFDDRGKQVNKNGELENWWSPATSVEYAKKAECIKNQYNNYFSEKLNLHLNGINTLGENIADNGAAKLAYETYQSLRKHNGDDKCLPSLNYTPNQLFWIAFANTWCAALREEQFKNEMLLSDHSPAYFRVIGVVSNSQHFANDFQCPVGSPMNPRKKCTFW